MGAELAGDCFGTAAAAVVGCSFAAPVDVAAVAAVVGLGSGLERDIGCSRQGTAACRDIAAAIAVAVDRPVQELVGRNFVDAAAVDTASGRVVAAIDTAAIALVVAGVAVVWPAAF